MKNSDDAKNRMRCSPLSFHDYVDDDDGVDVSVFFFFLSFAAVVALCAFREFVCVCVFVATTSHLCAYNFARAFLTPNALIIIIIFVFYLIFSGTHFRFIYFIRSFTVIAHNSHKIFSSDMGFLLSHRLLLVAEMRCLPVLPRSDSPRVSFR